MSAGIIRVVMHESDGLEQLREHTPFLARLARGLARDEFEAQELVQQTLLAAVEGRPRVGPGFRSWLGTVLRREALRRRRGELRRQKRERLAVRPCDLPSAQELALQLELERGLGHALGDLGEPYRSTILLRFRDGLPPRRIAARQEVPLNTVKTRLQRGLTRLRRRLGAYSAADLRLSNRTNGVWPVSKGPELPRGWIQSGGSPEDYQIGVDRTIAHSGASCGFIRCAVEEPQDFATLMQMCRPDRFRGKRVRMSAWVKTEDADWAALWLRVDGKEGDILAFDNMRERPIKGTSEWSCHEVVLEVPRSSEALCFGVLLSGRGQAWVDDFSFEAVSQEVEVTGGPALRLNPEPTNLTFEE